MVGNQPANGEVSERTVGEDATTASVEAVEAMMAVRFEIRRLEREHKLPESAAAQLAEAGELVGNALDECQEEWW